MKKYEDNEEQKKKNRMIIYIIIIVIIILSLITSCSCTSKFFGTIGDLYKNEGNFIIDDDTNDREIILNKDLRFDADNLEIFLSDNKPKLSYSYENINPKELTCTTSDAETATCYVKDGYVVINPKKVGKVTVYLQTEVNGKIYKASAIVTIKDVNRYITLGSKGGTIDLSKTNQKKVKYRLVGLSGDVSVSSSDSSIATATIKNGVLIITGLKPGTAKITLSITYNGITYKAEYTIKVINGSSSSNSSSESSGGNNQGGSGSENTGKKDQDSSLKNLILSSSSGFDFSSQYNFKSDVYDYTVIVGPNVKDISLDAIVNSPKAKVSINGQDVSSLKNIPLENGYNVITVKVTAEDGSESIYTIVIKKCYLETETYKKTISLLDNNGTEEIILNTNMFEDGFTVSKTENALRLTSNSDSNIYVDITTDAYANSIIELSVDDTDKATSSIPIKIKGINVGSTSFHVKGSALGNLVNDFDIQVDVVNKHIVYIDPNNGILNEFENYYEFLVEDGTDLVLPKIAGYKLDEDKNCYTLESFNTNPDGTGTRYELESTIHNVTSNIKLYAIYSIESSEILDSKLLDLGELALFGDEDLPTIKPGDQGYYVMNVTNKSTDDLTIVGMNLTEDTICIPNRGCLNMGYAIRYAPKNENFTYYYGFSSLNKVNYTILNKDSNKVGDTKYVDFANVKPITIPAGESIELTLMWKWVEVDDALDTLIGDKAAEMANEDLIYTLSVNLVFTKNNPYCAIE